MKVVASKTREVAPSGTRRARVGPLERCPSPSPGFASAMAGSGRTSAPVRGSREERRLGESLSTADRGLAPSPEVVPAGVPTGVPVDSSPPVALPSGDRCAPLDAEAVVSDVRGAGSAPGLRVAGSGTAARAKGAAPPASRDYERPAPAKRPSRHDASGGAAVSVDCAAPTVPAMAMPADDLVHVPAGLADRSTGAPTPATGHRIETATGSGAAASGLGRETVRIDLGDGGCVTLAPSAAGAGGTATLEVPAALATAPLISDLAACGWVARRRDAKSNEPAKAEGRHARRDRQGERRDADGGVGVGHV